MRRYTLRALLFLSSCALVFGFAAATERRAWGYTDPGSGLLILQSLGSAFMGAVLIFRRKLGRLLHRGASAETPAAPSPAAEPNPRTDA